MAEKPPSKTQILNNIAEQTGLSRKDVASVLESLNNQIDSAVSGEAGQFAIPGLCKIVRQIKPATEARVMKNPFKPGEMMNVAAKPERKIVKIRPLKALKDMVAGSAPAADPPAADPPAADPFAADPPAADPPAADPPTTQY